MIGDLFCLSKMLLAAAADQCSLLTVGEATAASSAASSRSWSWAAGGRMQPRRLRPAQYALQPVHSLGPQRGAGSTSCSPWPAPCCWTARTSRRTARRQGEGRGALWPALWPMPPMTAMPCAAACWRTGSRPTSSTTHPQGPAPLRPPSLPSAQRHRAHLLLPQGLALHRHCYGKLAWWLLAVVAIAATVIYRYES